MNLGCHRVAGHLFVNIALGFELQEVCFWANYSIRILVVVEGGVAEACFGIKNVEDDVRGFLH
jgi:hypothetical protein